MHRGRRRGRRRGPPGRGGGGHGLRHGRRRHERRRGVDGSEAGAVTPATLGPEHRALGEHVPHLPGSEPRELSLDERHDAGDDRAGRARAVQQGITGGPVGRGHAVPGRGQRHVCPVTGKGGLDELFVEGADRDDPGISRGIVHRAGGAAVAGRRDQHHVMVQRVANRGPLGRAPARARRTGLGHRVERQVDDRRMPPDRVPDPAGDGARQPAGDGRVAEQRVVAFQRHPDREDLGGRCDPHDPVALPRAVSVARDKTGHGRAVNAPEGPVRGAPRMRVVGAGDYRPGEVGLLRVDAGIEQRDGDAGALRGPPGARHVQRAEPPFLTADVIRQRGGAGHEHESQRQASGHSGLRTAGKAKRHGIPPVVAHVRIVSRSWPFRGQS